jgi:hypothetical protein
MRPTYNFEPRYRVMVLTREDWTIGTGTPPIVKGHVWFTDESRMRGWGQGRGVWTVCEKEAQPPPWKIRQPFRSRCLPFWPVLMTLKIMEHQRNM